MSVVPEAALKSKSLVDQRLELSLLMIDNVLDDCYTTTSVSISVRSEKKQVFLSKLTQLLLSNFFFF